MLPILASAQHFDTPLSHDIDAREVEYFETHPFVSPATRGETTPPDFDGLRTMAEWEEIEVLCVGWEGYSAIEKQIVVNAAEECHVLILTESPNEVESYLTSSNNGGPAASLDNITIIDTPMNTVWIETTGPTRCTAPAWTTASSSIGCTTGRDRMTMWPRRSSPTTWASTSMKPPLSPTIS